MQSSGLCEICGKEAVCNDVPSRHLNIPGLTMEQTRAKEAEMDDWFRAHNISPKTGRRIK